MALLILTNLEGAQPGEQEHHTHSCTHFMHGVEDERDKDVPQQDWTRSKHALYCSRLNEAGHIVEI